MMTQKWANMLLEKVVYTVRPDGARTVAPDTVQHV
jgi:hypothetical protein